MRNDTESLVLLARHFFETDYTSPYNCAISKAAKEHFQVDNATEKLEGLELKDAEYEHDYYGHNDFRTDWNKASKAGFDDTPIRTITLTLVA